MGFSMGFWAEEVQKSKVLEISQCQDDVTTVEVDDVTQRWTRKDFPSQATALGPKAD